MSKKSDFNDLQESEGIEAVKQQLGKATVPVGLEIKPWTDPSPRDHEKPAVLPFDFGLVPLPLRCWIQDIVERMHCPPEFVAIPVLIAFGSILGRKMGLRPKRHDDWIEVPTLWGLIIGNPGQMKTPAMNAALEPIRELERNALEKQKAAQKKYAAAITVYEIRKKNAAREITVALKAGDSGLADQIAANLEKVKPVEQTFPRFIVNDTTTEKLGVTLSISPNGVMLERDEISGWMAALDKTGREGDRQLYLEGWSGKGEFRWDRISRPSIHLQAIAISMIGGIQPGVLTDYFKKTLKKVGGGDGLLQRFQLMVQPGFSTGYTHVDRPPNSAAAGEVRKLAHYFAEAEAKDFGADISATLPFLHFSDEAQDIFNNWYTAFRTRIANPGTDPAFHGHICKFAKLVPSLALLFHALDRKATPVTTEALALALRWADFLESHALAIYSQLRRDTSPASELARHIEAGALATIFSERDVQRRDWSGLTELEVIRSALEELTDDNWVRRIDETEHRPGRPGSPTYEINPKVYQGRNAVAGRSNVSGADPIVGSVSGPPVDSISETSSVGFVGSISDECEKAVEGADYV